MISATQEWQRVLAEQADSLDDRQLAAFLRFHELATDDDLCDAIDIDSRARASSNRPTSLDRYLEAVPALEDRRVVLDAALEVALREIRRTGVAPGDAIAALKTTYPRLSERIDTAAVFDDFLASSQSSTGGGALPPSPMTLPVHIGDKGPDGQRRYMLMRVLGNGSQATVYLAVDGFLSSPDRPAWVAVKMFPRRARDEAESIAAAESRAVRRIDHPNVVQVLDRGRTDAGNEYVVFEYVEGAPLDKSVDLSDGGIRPREAARLIAGLAHGLQAAHNAGVLHRDLKPSNILVTKEGLAKIADFGLADRVRVYGPARGPVGSFAFMSPEQYRCDARASLATADVYSLGGVLYWLLTAKLPNGRTSLEIEQRLWKGESAAPLEPGRARPGLSADLVAIVKRATAPNPLDRYASADALAQDLERYLRHLPIDWRRPSLLRRTAMFARRSPVSAAVAMTGVLAISAGSAAAVAAWRLDAIRDLRVRAEISGEQAERARAEAAQARAEAEATLANQEAAVEKARLAGVVEMVTAARVMLRDPNTTPSEGWLRGTIVNEVIFGPQVLGVNTEGGSLWKDRIEEVRGVLDEAQRLGRTAEFEAMVWQSLLGYWLLRAGRHHEAVIEIDRALELWIPRLSSEDRFLESLRILRMTARLGDALETPATPREQVQGLFQELEAARTHTLPDYLREVVDGVMRMVH